MKEVMTELRRGNARRDDGTNYAADDESEGDDGPRRRLERPKSRQPGIRRRPAAQNALSVGFSVSQFQPMTYPRSATSMHT